VNKKDFMKELKTLLWELPEDEKQDALKYYLDYFEDAGVENEESVLREIGSPVKVAAQIKEDFFAQNPGASRNRKNIKANETKYSYGTNVGAETVNEVVLAKPVVNGANEKNVFNGQTANNTADNKANNTANNKANNAENINYGYGSTNAGSFEKTAENGYKPNGKKTVRKWWSDQTGLAKVLLIVFSVLVIIPIGVPTAGGVGITVISLGFAIVATIFAIFVGIISVIFGLVVTGVVLAVSGIFLIVVGIGTLIPQVAVGFVWIGIGLLLVVLGVIITVASWKLIVITFKGCIAIFRGLWNGIFRRRKAVA
jgi:hypothetical protein